MGFKRVARELVSDLSTGKVDRRVKEDSSQVGAETRNASVRKILLIPWVREPICGNLSPW